ncbi:MAG: hypothetical protein GXP31_01415 [Kiritimatiellaeota bacterium]|nr:hypothetical protein [Kiritimatiellota bacterium]
MYAQLVFPCVLVATAVALTGRAADMSTAASWIWYPEDVATQGVRQTRYLRKTLTLDSPCETARLRVRADDAYTLRINGGTAPKPLRSGPDGDLYDLARVLHPGKNVLAFSVYNAAGKGGLIVTGTLREKNGTVIPVYSDRSFRTSRSDPEGWDRSGFDDSKWPAAGIVGSAFSAPWFEHPAFDMTPFIRPDEWKQWNALRARLLELPEGLEREAPARAKFAFPNGSCTLIINGEPRAPLIYRGTVDPLSSHGRRQIALFRDAGVHVYTAYLPLASCWTGPGKYRFDALDDRVRGYLSVDPAAHIILILRLVPPRWWMDAHPKELVRYAAGADYNTTDECGRVRRPSLASKTWRREALAIWRAAIEHLEAKPWGKRVIGYQPGYGIYTEWHYFGSWRDQMPDTGPAMTACFRAWLRRKYGTVERLRAAWGTTDATFDTAAVPGVAPRRDAGPLGLRRPVRGRRVMDYYHCQQEVTADDVEAFCAAAKKSTGGRVVCGAFYGYFYGVLPQTQGGHLELERLLRSPAIDYFAAPYDYSHRLMGDDGRLRGIVDAFAAAGKVHMIEADTRTFLHPRNEYGRLADRKQTLAAIRREVATALTHGCALWWADFGGDGSAGWYDDPALIAEVKRMVRLSEDRLRRPRKRQAQVALVCDLRSCYWLGDGAAMRTHLALVDHVTTELYRTGTPFDTILLSQLIARPQPQYRVLIFLNTLQVTAAQRAALPEIVRDRAVLWLWAPGITDGRRFGPELVRALTGFRVRLDGDGLPVSTVECRTEHPLTADVPAVDAPELTEQSSTPIFEYRKPENWYNPRNAETMRRDYTNYTWAATGTRFRWTVATRGPWTDIHLRARIQSCDGLRLRLSGTGACAGAALRVAIKGADGGEFVAPGFTVPRVPTARVLPFQAFKRASWYRGKATKIAFPLKGLKLILNGVAADRSGTLMLDDLAAVKGDVKHRKLRRYSDPGTAAPILTIDDQAPETVVLGRDPGSGRAVLACRGEAGRRHVLSTVPFVPRSVLAALLDESGAIRFIRSDRVIVRADSELVSLHTATGGRFSLHLPGPDVVRDALSGRRLGTGPTFEVVLPPDSTTLFRLGD